MSTETPAPPLLNFLRRLVPYACGRLLQAQVTQALRRQNETLLFSDFDYTQKIIS